MEQNKNNLEQNRMRSSDPSDQDKIYNVGYVPGVFDLFHMGHLNLLRNAKERCNYLIAGVLTDELVYYFKKKTPFVPFEERMAIVEAIKYVDRVVPVDFNNTVKIDAWKLYHFDCHFSGNDHGADWDVDLAQLREVGSDMEFFQYTQGTSSTQLKKLIEERLV
jgi:glycerol-3-phosphate cytidylyltransferase